MSPNAYLNLALRVGACHHEPVGATNKFVLKASLNFNPTILTKIKG